MDLKACRDELDRIDAELLRLFSERMDIAAQVAAYKQANHLPVLEAAREREKLADIRQKSPEAIREYAVLLFSKLMELSRIYQSQLLAIGSEPSDSMPTP